MVIGNLRTIDLFLCGEMNVLKYWLCTIDCSRSLSLSALVEWYNAAA